MIGPDCDDEYPSSHPLLAALIGALGAVLAAGIGPWLAHQRERDREERERAERLARLEGMMMAKATEEDDADDGDGGSDAG